MKEPYGEGLASHTGPESCARNCKVEGEALTGAQAGGVFSREMCTKSEGRRRP
jgi:RNA-directed DNA polymerase